MSAEGMETPEQQCNRLRNPSAFGAALTALIDSSLRARQTDLLDLERELRAQLGRIIVIYPAPGAR